MENWGVLAFAISRYRESGYEMPRMRRIMTARRSVRSHRNDVSDRDGNNASMTFGIVSPTMTQKATMPPNALESVSAYSIRATPCHIQHPLCQRYGHQTRPPKAMLHGSLERVCAAEFRVDDDQADGPVHNDCKGDEENGACDEASLTEGVGLSDDSSTSVSSQPCALASSSTAIYLT
jgi:hypothetical protein